MQAVILAGGLGTRLRPVTERIPKAMVTVNGKPFLHYLLELFKSQGIKNIVLCIGYLGKQVRDAFGNGENFGLMIRYSEEKESLLGTGGALKQAQDLLEDYFLVVNGDTYLPIEYRELERAFIRRSKKAMIVVYENSENTGVRNNVELTGDYVVKRHDKERHYPGLKYVDAGALILQRDALNLMQVKHQISLEKGLYPALIEQRELVAYITNQRFYDIGTPEQIKKFEEFLVEGAR
jgi:NDP-sugar pyrophosphorylase family protein